jgi:catechol 2,3-dioxygenase-like lactoylglutathione lyase family enzyme
MKRALLSVLMLVAGATAPALADTPAAVGPATTIKGVRYVGVTVSDIDATLEFYNAAANYEVVKRHKAKGRAIDKALVAKRPREVEIALIRTPTVFLKLTDFDPKRATTAPDRPVIGPGYTHICFQSPAKDSAFAKFLAAGLRMVTRGGQPIDIGGYGVVYAYGRDPDGIMIENEILDRPQRSEPVWVSHVANVTPDIDRMTGFYEKVLGFAPHRRIERENHEKLDAIADIDNLKINGSWFRARNFELELWHYARPLTPARAAPALLDEIGYSEIAFEVGDLEREIARLRAENIAFLSKPRMVEGWKVVYARDPDGNLFSLQQNVSAGAAESIDGMQRISAY